MVLKNIGGKIKNKYFILGLLIILNLSLKVFILFNSNQLADPALDKCFLVNFAKDLLSNEEGLSLKYYFLPHDIVPGFISGTLLVISFFVFGISTFSLKIIPILTSTAIVSLVYIFMNKFFNKRAAIITSLLFIFAPFAYTIRTFINYGDYKVSILLTFLIMYIFFNIFYNNKKSYWNFILLGLISGFALSFYILNTIIILTIFLLWFSFDKKFFIKKNFLLFLISFLLILTPLIIFNFSQNFNGFDVIKLYIKTDNSLAEYKSNLPIHGNLIKLIINDVPASFNFSNAGFINGIFLNYVYYFIFIISFCFIFYKNRISIVNFIKKNFLFRNNKIIKKEMIFIVFPMLYVIFYLLLGLTPFSQFYYTHLLPIYPFIFISISLFFNYLFQKPNWRILSIILFSLILILGIKSNFDMISLHTKDRVDYLNDCDSNQVTSHRFIGFYLKDIVWAKKECQKLSRQNLGGCYNDIGYYIITTYPIEKNITKSINDCLLLDQYSDSCIQGLAIYAGGDERAPKICNFFPKEYQKECFFNFGRSIALNNKNYIEECKIVGDEYLNDCKKGYLAQKSKIIE